MVHVIIKFIVRNTHKQQPWCVRYKLWEDSRVLWQLQGGTQSPLEHREGSWMQRSRVELCSLKGAVLSLLICQIYGFQRIFKRKQNTFFEENLGMSSTYNQDILDSTEQNWVSLFSSTTGTPSPPPLTQKHPPRTTRSTVTLWGAHPTVSSWDTDTSP